MRIIVVIYMSEGQRHLGDPETEDRIILKCLLKE